MLVFVGHDYCSSSLIILRLDLTLCAKREGIDFIRAKRARRLFFFVGDSCFMRAVISGSPDEASVGVTSGSSFSQMENVALS